VATSPSSPEPTDKKALLLRLRKIGGQVRAIETMIEQEADSSDILTQTVSVRKALKSFSEVVIQEHLGSCMEGASTVKEAQRQMKDLLNVLKRYVE
jgi:DNA-binding FrmR family transcriptional regulator